MSPRLVDAMNQDGRLGVRSGPRVGEGRHRIDPQRSGATMNDEKDETRVDKRTDSPLPATTAGEVAPDSTADAWEGRCLGCGQWCDEQFCSKWCADDYSSENAPGGF
jgi:hypothetical protein